MSIWPEDGLLISDKHPLFLFMSVVFFGGCSSWLVAVNLGTLHYETLFDYYSLLSDPNASKLVEKYYNFYKKDISRKLKRRNWMRYNNVPLSAVSLASKRRFYIRKPSNLPTKRTDRAVNLDSCHLQLKMKLV